MTDDELKRLERQIEGIVAPHLRRIMFAAIIGLISMIATVGAAAFAAAEWKTGIEIGLEAAQPDPALREHLRKMSSDMQRDIASIDKEAATLRADVNAIMTDTALIKKDLRDVRRVLLGRMP